MIGFRLSAQRPPEARRITDTVIMRFDHVYEVDPELMGVVAQDDIPAWDTHRIVANRWDHLDWMHDHWADDLLSAEELQRPTDTPEQSPS
jgi:hypothetical protein